MQWAGSPRSRRDTAGVARSPQLDVQIALPPAIETRKVGLGPASNAKPARPRFVPISRQTGYLLLVGLWAGIRTVLRRCLVFRHRFVASGNLERREHGMSPGNLPLAVACWLSLWVAVPAYAVVLLDENFDRPDGALEGQSPTPGPGTAWNAGAEAMFGIAATDGDRQGGHDGADPGVAASGD